MVYQACMAYLAGESSESLVSTTMREETTAKSDTQTDYYEILHAMGHAIAKLTQSRHMGIIAQRNSHSQTVAQHGSQWYNALPR